MRDQRLLTSQWPLIGCNEKGQALSKLKLNITEQPDPVILIFQCYRYGSSLSKGDQWYVCVCGHDFQQTERHLGMVANRVRVLMNREIDFYLSSARV